MNSLSKFNDLIPDSFFIKIFKDPDIILSTDPSKLDWFTIGDFQIPAEYVVRLIKEIRGKIKKADDNYLYSASQQLSNVIACIRLIVVSAGPSYMLALERLFKEQFGDEKIYKKTYDACFEKWLHKKNGQYLIGLNYYNILNGNLYYRDRFGQWFEIDKETAFDLQPNRKCILKDKDMIVSLNKDYKETQYDKIIKLWDKKEFTGVLTDDFLRFKNRETSPEKYFDFTVKYIKKLIKNPVSIKELERWNGGEIADLEHIIKISVFLFDFISNKNRDHTVYLLRDCLIFYELRKALDILTGEDTSTDQLLIGRKLFNSKNRAHGYWIMASEIFNNEYKRHPTNFAAFYNEYSRLMNRFFSLNPDFAKLITNISKYIKKHIRTNKKNIIFDVGFNGTINLITKYIIDNHIHPKRKTEVKLYVGAPWFKKLFKKRHETNSFFLLHHIQLMARSEHLYHYKPESLKSGKLKITMGDKEWQHKAAVELVILIMVALLKQKK